MAAPTLDLKISQGKTLNLDLLYAEETLVYRPLTGISNLAPAQFTVPAHGIPDSWPVRIESAKAPGEILTAPGQWKVATSIDADTIELNDLNLLAAKAFVGPAVLIYKAPGDLTGWKIRMQIRDKVGGVVLLDASSDLADASIGSISVDIANSAIHITFPDEITAAITWLKAVYDVEAILPDGSVVGIISPSKVTLEQEVTVWA